MFTGIIQEIGIVASKERARGLIRLGIHAPHTASRAQPLESVAVNGVCLSVVALRQGTLWFEVIPETQRLTALAGLRRGDSVNLEPSLCVCDRLSGHLVFGHVDAMGTLRKRRQLPGELVLEIRVAPRIRQYLVAKGPVTVQGVSLTVGARLGASTFRVHLIPETLRQTTLSALRVGQRVNVEIDYFAKLVRQFLHSR
jgi:riboflavin synthase